MKNENRLGNSIRNMIWAVGGYVITVLLAFVDRSVFASMLSQEVMGVNGVVSSIISVLSITELGIGEAIMFSMYGPIRENNTDQIQALLNLYKKAYLFISSIITIISVSLIPVLPSFFRDDCEVDNLVLIYLLFIANMLASYYGAHRRTMIIAYQKQYIVSICHTLARSAMYVVEILVLLITKNYVLYLCIGITGTFAESLSIHLTCAKLYPFVRKKNKVILSKDERSTIFHNIYAMFMHKVGGTIVNTTDNLIISKFVGLIQVGIYSNYMLIRSVLTTVTSMVFRSMVASVGNLGNEETEHAMSVFYRIFYASAWLFGWCSICLICLYNDFIFFWIGKEYLFSITTVILIVFSFYITGIRQTVLMTKEAFGLFWQDRFKPLAEAAVNLVASIFLARKFGIDGVITGTIISAVTVCLWLEPYILFKYGFKHPVFPYFSEVMRYTIIILLSFLLTWWTCGLLPSFKFGSFIVKCLICIVVPNVAFMGFTFKTREFKYYFDLFKSVFLKIKH